MKLKFVTAAAAILAVSLFASYANAGQDKPVEKKHAKTEKAKTPKPPTVQEQIQELRQEFQGQINELKTDLANKDAELRQAKQAAADAQAAADRANAAASATNQAIGDNASAVSTLQSTVKDLKGTQESLANTVSDETSKIKKELNSPNVLHFKGVGITPGGYAAGETVWRTHATGGDIPTAFNALPYEGADAYSLSEFYGSARQSRVSMMAQGKTNWGTLRGYWEADWLGTGITSNNNQSNSYVLRQRVLWAQAETNTGWAFTAGQLWSLATEDKVGISNLSGDILTPQTIDPNYNAGFVWTRQYGFRVTKTFPHAAFGFAAENPQLLYTASLAGNTPYAVVGSAGANGGNYNPAISASSTTTYIQNYSNGCTTWNTASTPVCLPGTPSTPIPVYATIVANANVANISFNQAPDILFKAAFDPGWGHYEVFGIAGFAHETVYPGTTTNSVKYGGIKDIATGANVWASSTATGFYNNSIVVGGVGGSLRVPVIKNKLDFGAKGLYGPGVGRYGDSSLPDITADANGNFAPIHNVSGLFTLEATPTPRLTLYVNYGGDYAARTDFSQMTGINGLPATLGSPAAEYCPTTSGAFTCTKTPTAADIALGGAWGGHWSAASAAAQGYGSRLAVNSSCDTPTAPGYNSGSSNGYIPGSPSSSTCTGQTRDVQEITGGWWYDVYKGDHGRFRQGFQYSYAVREAWSGAGTPALGAKGTENMFWTSIRYYLP